MITMNSVVQFQNLAINHKSQPIKSNPALCVYYPQEGAREPINYSHMPNKQRDQKFDHPRV